MLSREMSSSDNKGNRRGGSPYLFFRAERPLLSIDGELVPHDSYFYFSGPQATLLIGGGFYPPQLLFFCFSGPWAPVLFLSPFFILTFVLRTG